MLLIAEVRPKISENLSVKNRLIEWLFAESGVEDILLEIYFVNKCRSNIFQISSIIEYSTIFKFQVDHSIEYTMILSK